MRVLVTEDDEVLATALAGGLRREGMAVDVALDGEAALERLAVNRYDVVVLDRDPHRLPPLRVPRGMPAACFPGSQAAGDSQVTFSGTVLSPPPLYNRTR